MSELKVNTITPAAGNQVTVAGQVLGVPGTEPYHFATVSQLGGGGAGGISRAEAQELVTTGVASANRHSDEKDELQNTSTTIAIGIAKTEAVSLSKEYTDDKIDNIVQGDYFNNVEMPNWTYQTTWTNDAGQTGPRIQYNKFNTNRFDSQTTGKFQIAGINGISVTGATGYDTMTTGTGGTELIPYQRVIVDGSNVASLGVGQTWQDVKASRAVNTVYTNNTGKPIMVSFASNTTSEASISVGGVVICSHDNLNAGPFNHSFIVPAVATYLITSQGTVRNWTELR